jgi:hypothetical protein
MAKKDTPAGQVKARVLMDCQFGKVDDVVVFESADEAAAAAGQVDTNPEAVAYAESLTQRSDE